MEHHLPIRHLTVLSLTAPPPHWSTILNTRILIVTTHTCTISTSTTAPGFYCAMTTQPPSLESYPLVSLEPANLGLPSGLDLFDKEYSWYIATGNLGSEVGDIGHSLLQSCRASASFFLIPEKRVEVRLCFTLPKQCLLCYTGFRSTL